MTYVTKAISSAQLSKNITSIGNRGKKLDGDIQSSAVQCLIQLAEHRNADPASKLVKALGKSANRKALMAYFEEFAPLKRKVKGKTKAFDNYSIDKDAEKIGVIVDVVGAEQVNFWDFQPQKEVIIHDQAYFIKRADTLVKALRKELNEAEFNAVRDHFTSQNYNEAEVISMAAE